MCPGAVHHPVAEPGLDVEVAELFEPELLVERNHVLLGVNHHGCGAVKTDDLGDQELSESFTATVGTNGYSTELAAGGAVARFGILNDPQICRGAELIRYPQVLCPGFLIAIIELLDIDSLFDEEDIGAEFEKGVQLGGGEFAPCFADRGTFGHRVDFNVSEVRFFPELTPPPSAILKESPMPYNVNKTEAEWGAQLGPEQYQILREAATERAWSGELLDESRSGFYTCAGCDAELFKSGTKFDSHCGWPSFYESVNPEAVELLEDTSLGVVRTEVRCANCGSHLGHIFDDGFGTPTGDRYCMNSLSLGFTEATE